MEHLREPDDIVALAGGVGAGKFLRGLASDTGSFTVVVNTGDDITLHGLHICPDVDSVVYALAGEHDPERGWGRRDETFRATTELRARFDSPEAWFNLGDLDLATHLFRTDLLRRGATLTEATAALAGRFGISARILPMSDDPAPTMVETVDPDTGAHRTMHFQEYWVRRGARDAVNAVRLDHARVAHPAPGVLEALAAAPAILICPSNPVASLAPILAVRGIREELAAHRDRVVGISPIVRGAPLRGMADKLMPAAGLEVTALGAARAYEGLLGAWVVDERDRDLAPLIERELGVRVGITNTIMSDDDDAAALARFARGMIA
jgi:LPPG:FO 2-phospho-L-lactate transferase